jgi:hypothetical protein
MNLRQLSNELFQKPAGRLLLFLLAGALILIFILTGNGHRSIQPVAMLLPAQATTAKGYSFTE